MYTYFFQYSISNTFLTICTMAHCIISDIQILDHLVDTYHNVSIICHLRFVHNVIEMSLCTYVAHYTCTCSIEKTTR